MRYVPAAKEGIRYKVSVVHESHRYFEVSIRSGLFLKSSVVISMYISGRFGGIVGESLALDLDRVVGVDESIVGMYLRIK